MSQQSQSVDAGIKLVEDHCSCPIMHVTHEHELPKLSSQNWPASFALDAVTSKPNQGMTHVLQATSFSEHASLQLTATWHERHLVTYDHEEAH